MPNPIAVYAYADDGHAFRMVGYGHTPGVGEVVFETKPSVAALQAAFPNYDSVKATRDNLAAIEVLIDQITPLLLCRGIENEAPALATLAAINVDITALGG